MQWVADINPDVDAAVITLARQAVLRRPDKESRWRTLAVALLKSSAPAEALDCVDTALTKFPTSTELILYRSRALLDLGDYDRALRSVERALALSPADIGARILHCDTLTRMKNWSAAAATLEQIAPAASNHPAFFDLKTRILFHESALLELVSLCDSQLARFSGHTSATYYKARVLAKLGKVAEARELLSLDRYIEISSLPTPAGFVSNQDFRDALVAEITRNPTLVRDPRDKATREGLQTRFLRQPDAPTVEALIKQIKIQVEGYVEKLGASAHGFTNACPAKASLTAWAVIYDAEGRQTVHHHPGGWLSGVFYPQAPCLENTFSGSLILGALETKGDGNDPPSGMLEVEPVPGRIVMFPSYTPHATKPPGVAGRRIVVAFDIVPQMQLSTGHPSVTD